jgi:hypothetical protein
VTITCIEISVFNGKINGLRIGPDERIGAVRMGFSTQINSFEGRFAVNPMRPSYALKLVCSIVKLNTVKIGFALDPTSASGAERTFQRKIKSFEGRFAVNPFRPSDALRLVRSMLKLYIVKMGFAWDPMSASGAVRTGFSAQDEVVS